MAQSFPNIEFQIVDSGSGGVTGILDVNQVTDFPLALTYSIKDVQDPQSSKGSFSKTFQIPATGNNNKILKNLYSDSLYNSYQYIEDQDAQIFMDGMVVLSGKFQIKGTLYEGVPQSYECVVFGDNFQWVNALSELNLCDIDFTAGNFFPDAPTFIALNHEEIQETWEFGLAGETISGDQTHVVFPLINKGKWNYTEPYTFNPVVTPSDLDPAFYLYNMLKCIFGAHGYTLESKFIDSDWFKRLITLTPMAQIANPQATIEQYSFSMSSETATDWKTPLNYTNTVGTASCAGLGNDFDGAVLESTIIDDPSGLITLNDTHTPSGVMGMNPVDPSGLHTMGQTELPTLAGWYFGAYGQGNQSWFPRLTQYGMLQINGADIFTGYNWDEIPCTMQGGASGTYSEPINGDMFSTPYYGQYEFSGSVLVEMDNDYEIDNDVAGFDPLGSGLGVFSNGTNGGGWNLPCMNTVGSDPEMEWLYNGTTYVANLFVAHYKKSTGETHMVLVDSDRKEYANLPLYFNLWCEDNPLPSTPNLQFKLEFSGVQLDVLDDDDKVFLYTEVTSERWRWEESQYAIASTLPALCQMKYRILESEFNGNLTPEIVEGGSVALSALLPCDTTQLEYVNGLTGLFNLMLNHATGFLTFPQTRLIGQIKLTKGVKKKMNLFMIL